MPKRLPLNHRRINKTISFTTFDENDKQENISSNMHNYENTTHQKGYITFRFKFFRLDKEAPETVLGRLGLDPPPETNFHYETCINVDTFEKTRHKQKHNKISTDTNLYL